MMKLIKHALIFLSFFIASHAQSQQRISAFICDDINSCNGNCIYQNRKFTFLIDKSRSVVKMNVYENEVLARSLLFENCKAIFNDRNWDCTEKTEHTTGVLISAKQMNDGIYTTSLTNYRNVNGVMNISRDFAVCAK